jgi:hypothetical protein
LLAAASFSAMCAAADGPRLLCWVWSTGHDVAIKVHLLEAHP